MKSTQVADGDEEVEYTTSTSNALAADPVVQYMSEDQIEKTIKHTRKQMEKAAKELDFIEAARLRDELFALENIKKSK